ncbi:MAG: archaeosortase/exosortase family protein [Myxococcota bacterium]
MDGIVMARGALWLRSAVYVALVVALSNLLLLAVVDRVLLEPVRLGIASAAGHVLALVSENVRVAGQRVFVDGSAVEIVNSCTGIDVGVFLACAMLVFPAPWRARALGVLAAFAIVFAVNFLRVLTLCLLNAGSPSAFELVHVYVWPAFISGVCLATLLVWIQLVPASDA